MELLEQDQVVAVDVALLLRVVEVARPLPLVVEPLDSFDVLGVDDAFAREHGVDVVRAEEGRFD